MRRMTRTFRNSPFQGGVTVPNKTQTALAIKYALDDQPSASQVGSRLANILECLDSETSVSALALQYLKKTGLITLHNLATGQISFAEYLATAQAEQSERKQAMEIRRHQDELERQQVEEARDQAMRIASQKFMAAKLAYESDPKNIARAKQAALKEKYGLDYFIEKAHFSELMAILQKVEAGTRLSDEEVVWLSTTKAGYEQSFFTRELKAAYHRNEARFHSNEFQKTKDPWAAVNASKHYRKCGESSTAEAMLGTIDIDGKHDIKIKSALCTTYGGVKRDLGKYSEALYLGEKSHRFTPQNFRPCTLLGAVNIEIGNYDLGQSWYEKAAQRGASPEAIDEELRSIFRRADQEKQDTLRKHLLNIDPVRYGWTKTLKCQSSSKV
jgi:TPR repeat protein